MTTHSKKLLVIITEAALEKQLAHDVLHWGAHGYTVSDVRGAGMTGAREGAWEADRTIEMKVICDATVAEHITAHVMRSYSDHFGLALFVTDVFVTRAAKY